MTEKRYYKKDWEESYYVFDSNTISEDEFEERVEYVGYDVFGDSLTGSEIIDLLNENEELKKENNALKNIIQDFIIKEFKITKEDIINGKGGDATDFSSVIDEFFNKEVNISEIQVELKGEKNND